MKVSGTAILGTHREGADVMKCYFHHEKLDVYQTAIEFVAWSECLLESCRGKASSAKRHLEEASASIPNNIAEGNGKWSKRDRKKFFEIARTSRRSNVRVALTSWSRDSGLVDLRSRLGRKSCTAWPTC